MTDPSLIVSATCSATDSCMQGFSHSLAMTCTGEVSRSSIAKP